MFTDAEKDAISYSYSYMNIPQTKLGTMYKCSRRTIYRVLKEKGVLPETIEVTEYEAEMMTLLRDRNISYSDLNRALMLLSAERNYRRDKTKKSSYNSVGAARV